MGLGTVLKALGSSRLRRISIFPIVVEAVQAFWQGKRRVGALLLGAAVLASRSSVVGILVHLLIRRYRKQRRQAVPIQE